MSKKTKDVINEKEIKKIEINQNKQPIVKKINKITNSQNKATFLNNKRNKIQINTKEELLIERKSFNNESSHKNVNKKEKNENNNENNVNNDNNENNDNLESNEAYNEPYIIDGNDEIEKPPNAIEISDLIGEKCPIDLDILSLDFNNYESSKTSSKQMGLIHAYGANTYQGLVRNYNEDRVSIIINMAKPKNYTKNYWPKTSFFGIYDGHGGNQCSEYLRDSLHKLILNDTNYPENVELAIKNGFKNAEKDFLENFAIDKNDNNNILDRSGSCAVIILFVDAKIYVANVGDSRALFSENYGKNYVEITDDHKPNNIKEKNRIIKNGGHVYQSQTVINGTEKENLNGHILFGPYRVLPGRLSVSRTIGDIEAKYERFGGNPNVIICEPDIFMFDLKKKKIDFFIMGCDGIFDQMSNDEVIDCAWMILNYKNNEDKNKNINKNILENNDNYNENEEDEIMEYNFENCNIHEKCGFIVDFIIKASMVRKSFDNVTCLMIALSDFVNIDNNNNNNNTKIINSENKDLNNINIISKSKKSAKIITKRKNEIVKPKEAKSSDSHLINNNQNINNLNNINNMNKELPRNSAKENIKLANFMNSKHKINSENFPKTFRNTRTEFKNNYNTNANILTNNKIYIKKRKERNLQKKKTNKTEITMNGDSNSSNFIVKKMLNKSEFQEGRKTDINNNHNKSNDKKKNIINKDKLNINQSQNNIVNNYISPIKSDNNLNYNNNNNLIHKLRHNKIKKIPFELNNKIINNTNNYINNINFHFYYSNTGSNDYKKLPNLKTTTINNISNINQNISQNTASSVTNNMLKIHIKPKKLKNITKPKTFRYNNNGLNPYRKALNKNNNANGSKTHYSSNTHNISDYNSLYSHNYSNNVGVKNKKRGSLSSRKKKYSYHQIIKTLSLNPDNILQNKVKQLSNKKLSYSKEKDIQNFLYKNKTNIKGNTIEKNDLNKKNNLNKFSKIAMKSEIKKIKKIS